MISNHQCAITKTLPLYTIQMQIIDQSKPNLTMKWPLCPFCYLVRALFCFLPPLHVRTRLSWEECKVHTWGCCGPKYHAMPQAAPCHSSLDSCDVDSACCITVKSNMLWIQIMCQPSSWGSFPSSCWSMRSKTQGLTNNLFDASNMTLQIPWDANHHHQSPKFLRISSTSCTPQPSGALRHLIQWRQDAMAD